MLHWSKRQPQTGRVALTGADAQGGACRQWPSQVPDSLSPRRLPCDLGTYRAQSSGSQPPAAPSHVRTASNSIFLLLNPLKLVGILKLKVHIHCRKMRQTLQTQRRRSAVLLPPRCSLSSHCGVSPRALPIGRRLEGGGLLPRSPSRGSLGCGPHCSQQRPAGGGACQCGWVRAARRSGPGRPWG